MSEAQQQRGVIGEYQEDGFPVVVKFVDEQPDQDTRKRFPVLTVISWKYDGSERNGMPLEAVNERMLTLEHAIDVLESQSLCRHAYSRTGNGLKELVYYIAGSDQFMGAFNEVLRDHPRYPIEITFYDDPDWSYFEEFRGPFKNAE